MGREGWSWLLASPIIFAGCLDQGHITSEPFAVAAPPWSAGYEWSYLVESEESGRFQDYSGRIGVEEEDPSSMVETITVFNTTHRVGPDLVYYAWYQIGPDPRGPRPLAEEALYARSGSYYDADYRPVKLFRTADLSAIGSGTITLDVASCYNHCNYVYLHEDSENGPHLQFPLEPGKTWTETVGGEDDGFSAFEITYDVVGRRAVENPGPLGTRTGTYVHASGRMPDEDRARALMLSDLVPHTVRVQSSSFDFEFTGDYYWGEEERNLLYARQYLGMSFRVTGTDEDGEKFVVSGEFHTKETRTLRSYSLVAQPETRLPPVSITGFEDGDLERLTTLQIEDNGVSERPPNIANGPAQLRFSIASWDYPRHYGSAADESGADTAGAASPKGFYNESRFDVKWTLRRAGTDEAFATGQGPRFESSLSQGGNYQVQAVFHDRLYDTDVKVLSSQFPVNFAKTVRVSAEPGLAGRTVLIRFPVESLPAKLDLSWHVEADTIPIVSGAQALDSGFYVLEGPGSRQTFHQANAVSPFPGPSYPFTSVHDPAVGEWEFRWEPNGPAVLGDDHTVTVNLAYLPSFYSKRF